MVYHMLQIETLFVQRAATQEETNGIHSIRIHRAQSFKNLPGVHELWAGLPTAGSGRSTEEHSRPFIQRALELGINFFDTANVYSSGMSEEVVGRALHDFAAGMRWSSPPRCTG